MRASSQTDNGCGVGIWAENSDSSSQSITIQNSTVYNVDGVGILTASGATPTLSVNVSSNVVNAGTGLAGILADSVNGQVRNNNISNASVGVFDAAPTVSVASNTIMATGSGYGMFLLNGGTAVSNNVSGSNIGVFLAAAGAAVRSNHIVSSTAAGVELNCFTATVSGNFINDAAVGLDQAPAGTGSNTFANTATTITNGCVSAAAASRVMRANSQEPWHTPATPFGIRRK